MGHWSGCGPSCDSGACQSIAPERCDYCGELGHGWAVHPEAVADVRAWERESDAAAERQELSGWWAE